MRYICENEHVFEHTAKMITRHPHDEEGTIETPACPICLTVIYSEYVLDRKKISSVMSVPLDTVDSLLAEGYEVEALYAKTATLVRRE